MDSIYQDVIKTSKSLMLGEPFYGLILISLNKELSKSIPTACVTPDNINTKLMINPDFWNTLDDKTKKGVLKHELLHMAFFHLVHYDRFPNKKLYNVAADLEINQYIDSSMKGETWDGLEIDKSPFQELNLEPKQGTKYYYDKLQQEMSSNPNGDIAQACSDFTGHELWEAIEGMGEAEKKLITKQIDHQLKEIADELEKRSKGRGLIPKEMREYIDSLFEVKEPVIDWKSYLRRFSNTANQIFTKKTRRKPNKRFNSGPALKIKIKKRTLVAIDTSGSISSKDLEEFFNEIYHIHKTGIEVDIVECDAKIQRIYEFDGKRDNISVQGRGGTDYEPVMKYLIENKNKYGNLIYLTDGCCNPPQTNPIKPILWVFASGYKMNEDLPGAKVQIK